jgi:S-DNA-T family DNA segregation ATPase FtsK/SpoIIIE
MDQGFVPVYEGVDGPEGPTRLVAAIGARWAGHRPAPPILTLPAEVGPADLPDPAGDAGLGIAVGLEEFGLVPLRLDLLGADGHLLVLGDDGCGKTGLLRGLLRRLAAAHPPERARFAVIDPRRQLVGTLAPDRLLGQASTPGGIAELAERLVTELHDRLPAGELDAEPAVGPMWTGPDLVLVVDDYDLVAGPASSPLAGLVDLLGQGRDVGFHVVVARRVGGLARSAFEPFLARLRELGPPTLLLAGDPEEGPVVGRRSASRQPPGRGELLRRGSSPVLVQVLNHPPAPPATLRPPALWRAQAGRPAPGRPGPTPGQPPRLVGVHDPGAEDGAA